MATKITNRVIEDGTITTAQLSAGAVTAEKLAVNSAIPVGAVMTFACINAPTGWLALSGQTVNRTDYANLWTFAQNSGNIQTDANWFSLSAQGAFSQGNGSTTFRLPDLRGHFIRGSGTNVNGAAAATFGRRQDDGIREHFHRWRFSLLLAGPGGGYMADGAGAYDYNIGMVPGTAATETRPVNIPLLYCIKY